MVKMHWTAEPMDLGHPEMDATHREFIDLLAVLDRADDRDFPELFQRLIAHTRAHFGREEEMMAETRFPATAEHIGEHRRVLGEMEGFGRQVERGRVYVGRAYLREMVPDWFSLHLATMDSALAAHLRKLAA